MQEQIDSLQKAASRPPFEYKTVKGSIQKSLETSEAVKAFKSGNTGAAKVDFEMPESVSKAVNSSRFWDPAAVARPRFCA